MTVNAFVLSQLPHLGVAGQQRPGIDLRESEREAVRQR